MALCGNTVRTSCSTRRRNSASSLPPYAESWAASERPISGWGWVSMTSARSSWASSSSDHSKPFSGCVSLRLLAMTAVLHCWLARCVPGRAELPSSCSDASAALLLRLLQSCSWDCCVAVVHFSGSAARAFFAGCPARACVVQTVSRQELLPTMSPGALEDGVQEAVRTMLPHRRLCVGIQLQQRTLASGSRARRYCDAQKGLITESMVGWGEA